MTQRATGRIRCAIYTRVSTEHGLDQDFNSLDAQREAAEAYIRSQAHAGWILIRARYDDGGYSGGSTDRPALQQLLGDVKAGKIDIVVVYKVDRLTRSLADFAKLVELFDAHRVSFVSVTQQFNTTTSMGRLTLNVLLSFAQFEREVTSERIRDKIAASKRKGLWVGGMVPLGYESRDRKLVVHSEEAERVRHIFQRYLELGSIGALLIDLRHSGILTKVRRLSNGRTTGGIPFTRGPLAYTLRNRFYIGEVVYRAKACPGEHPAIIDRDLFEAVQAKLSEQRASKSKTRSASEALLLGRIFDDCGNRMTPSHCRKQGRKYRYYVSCALARGQPDQAGSVTRVPALEIESLICDVVRTHLGDGSCQDPWELVRSHVTRVDVADGELRITLNGSGHQPSSDAAGAITPHADENRDSTQSLTDREAEPASIRVRWNKPAKPYREIMLPYHADPTRTRPMRAEIRATLISAIARGRQWLSQLVSGDALSIEEIAARENSSRRHVYMTISLAFLAPSLVKAAVDGKLPHGMGVSGLYDLPALWRRQFDMVGVGREVEASAPSMIAAPVR